MDDRAHSTRVIGTVSQRQRIALTPAGQSGNGYIYGGGAPLLSADGRYATVSSSSSDLVPDDTNNSTDASLSDLERRRTRWRISLGNP